GAGQGCLFPGRPGRRGGGGAAAGRADRLGGSWPTCARARVPLPRGAAGTAGPPGRGRLSRGSLHADPAGRARRPRAHGPRPAPGHQPPAHAVRHGHPVPDHAGPVGGRGHGLPLRGALRALREPGLRWRGRGRGRCQRAGRARARAAAVARPVRQWRRGRWRTGAALPAHRAGPAARGVLGGGRRRAARGRGGAQGPELGCAQEGPPGSEEGDFAAGGGGAAPGCSPAAAPRRQRSGGCRNGPRRPPEARVTVSPR
ncbi:unnamed protein product, partial [Prorocentrum cordatum]